MIFVLYCAHLFVTFTFGESALAQKIPNKFGFSFAYSYLCTSYGDEKYTYQRL